jgi:hypothetical protein
MAIADDVLIDYTNKRLYANDTFDPSADSAYTTNALYSFMMDTFDDSGQMDDDVPMSAQTPNAYTMINGWYITRELLEWLEDGAIETVGYEDEIHYFEFASGGYTNAVAGDIGKMVNDDGVDFGTLLEYNNDKLYWVVRTGSSTTMASSSVVTIDSGTGAGTTNIISRTGECLHPNLYTLGTMDPATPRLYIVQDGAKLTDYADSNPYWWSMGHIDVLVTTTCFGVEIDSGEVTVFNRHYPSGGGAGNISLYDHFPIDLSAGGRNAVPIATSVDGNNDSSHASIEDYADSNIDGDGTSANIDISFGLISRDLGNGDGFNNYYVDIDCDSQTLDIVYEVLKWVAREDSDTSLTNQTGSIAGHQYRTYGDVDGWAEIKQSPFGTFAGGKFFGARGVWLSNVNSGDIQNYELIDASGTKQVPPNTVAVAISSVVAGDQCFCARLTAPGGEIETDTYTGAGSGNGSGDPDFVIQESIDSDVPAAGWFVIENGDGTQDVYKYSSWTGSTFTLDVVEHAGGLTATYNSSEDVWIALIHDTATSTEISNTLIYDEDIPVIIRVRKYGIIPFEIEGTVTSSGLSQAAIRTTDSIVS